MRSIPHHPTPRKEVTHRQQFSHPCKHGATCYRKEPTHFILFTHPQGAGTVSAKPSPQRQRAEQVDVPPMARAPNIKESWTCSACTLLNDHDAPVCIVCGAPCPFLPPQSPPTSTDTSSSTTFPTASAQATSATRMQRPIMDIAGLRVVFTVFLGEKGERKRGRRRRI